MLPLGEECARTLLFLQPLCESKKIFQNKKFKKKRDTVKKMERRGTDWKKILVKHLIKDVYPEYISKYNSLTRKSYF